MLKHMNIKEILSGQFQKKNITIYGWVKSKRGSKNVCFIAVNDGSCLKSIQIVIESRLLEQKVIKEISTGASIKVKGILVASKGGEQAFCLLYTSPSPRD